MLKGYVNTEAKIKIENNRLLASDTIKPGSTLFIEPPLASVPLPSKRHQRCNYCLKKAKLQCCSRCRSAYFCSNECFRNAWLHFHRVLCEPQEADIYKSVEQDRWLLERTALTLDSYHRLNKQQSHSSPYFQFSTQTLQLHIPVTYQTKEEEEKNNNTVKDIAEFLEPFDCQMTMEELDVLWRRIQASSFPIHDPEHQMEQVAIGVYPITSLFVGHSCYPNAALLYKEGTQYLVALDTISIGEPITITYIDLISTKTERTKELQIRFGSDFVCRCRRCEGDLDCIDAALDKAEAIGMTLNDGFKFISEHIQTWSVLDMIKRGDTKDQDSWSSIQTLEPPQFSHFVSRIAFPDLHYAYINEQKTPDSDVAFREVFKEDRAHLCERIVKAMQALLDVPNIPSFTLSSIRAAEQILLERISDGSWVQASRCAIYLNVVYRIIYPQLHPKSAYHTLIMARSAWNALVEMELIGVEGKLERIYANGTKAFIGLASEIINIIFGQKSTLWRDVVELQWVYERERKVSGA